MNKRELVEALLAGKEVKSKSGAQLRYDPNGKGNPFRFIHSDGTDDQIHNDTWGNLRDFHIVTPWQENIGKGKLCWVWDSHLGVRAVRLVTGYDLINEFPYRVSCTGYSHAEPLTQEELKEYSV